MATSSPGQRRLEVLTHEACVERLQRGTVGRMGVAWRGEPHVLPVNYRWVGDAVIVRTDAGTPLGNAAGQIAVL
jgi:nitroimidazol reductase NimA-like FMN-containing flavoprotein (pyridoxamine 5'-phosphate oxidase superfamily)